MALANTNFEEEMREIVEKYKLTIKRKQMNEYWQKLMEEKAAEEESKKGNTYLKSKGAMPSDDEIDEWEADAESMENGGLVTGTPFVDVFEQTKEEEEFLRKNKGKK